MRLSIAQRAYPPGVDATHPGSAPPEIDTVPFTPPLPAGGNATTGQIDWSNRPMLSHAPFAFYDGWRGFRFEGGSQPDGGSSQPAGAADDTPPPLGVSASGNTTLLIDSFGLDTDPARTSYSCVFTRNSDSMSAKGTPLSRFHSVPLKRATAAVAA